MSYDINNNNGKNHFKINTNLGINGEFRFNYERNPFEQNPLFKKTYDFDESDSNENTFKNFNNKNPFTLYSNLDIFGAFDNKLIF